MHRIFTNLLWEILFVLFQKPTPTRGPRIRRFKKLPRDLQGSLGQASLHLAAGCLDKAIEKCMEVIRIAPDAADAYKTLGTIYMQQGILSDRFSKVILR